MAQLETLLLSETEQDRQKAADIILAGGVVGVPTETVYGLAADASNVEAVNKIFTAKNRPNNHPLIVHIHSMRQLNSLALDVPPEAIKLAKAFWPGPLTMLFKKQPTVINEVTGGLPTVGIRMPDHPVLRSVLARGNLFVAAPSANPHKQLSATTAKQVYNELYGRIDAVIDGGFCNVGVESTIVDMTPLAVGDCPRILRAGPITASMISHEIQRKVIGYRLHNQQVPGNIDQHYQPKGQMSVVTAEDIMNDLSNWPLSRACVGYSRQVLEAFAGQQNQEHLFALSSVKSEYARLLYSTLYQLDQHGFEQIWVEQPPQTEDWEDINDRLRRAQA